MSIGEKNTLSSSQFPFSSTFRQEYEKQENARRTCPTGLREDEVDASGESCIRLDHLDLDPVTQVALAAC